MDQDLGGRSCKGVEVITANMFWALTNLPSNALRALHVLPTLWGGTLIIPILDEEVEVQWAWVTHPRSYTQQIRNLTQLLNFAPTGGCKDGGKVQSI